MRKPQTSRSTIGRDPWDTVIPIPVVEAVVVPERKSAPVREAKAPKSETPPAPKAIRKIAPKPQVEDGIAVSGRQKLTVHLDEKLVNRVKNAAYWNPRLTIARIAEEGIRHAIDKIERENGGPYAQRESELVGGRPMK